MSIIISIIIIIICHGSTCRLTIFSLMMALKGPKHVGDDNEYYY